EVMFFVPVVPVNSRNRKTNRGCVEREREGEHWDNWDTDKALPNHLLAGQGLESVPVDRLAGTRRTIPVVLETRARSPPVDSQTGPASDARLPSRPSRYSTHRFPQDTHLRP